jgi:hypothetical protein
LSPLAVIATAAIPLRRRQGLRIRAVAVIAREAAGDLFDAKGHGDSRHGRAGPFAAEEIEAPLAEHPDHERLGKEAEGSAALVISPDRVELGGRAAQLLLARGERGGG